MFLIWVLGSIQMQIFMKTEIWFISFIIYFGLIFGWIYSIGKVLNEKNAEILKRLNIWSIIYLISIIPFILNFHNLEMGNFEEMNKLISIPAGIIAFISILNVVLISSKSLKQTEKHKELTFSNYAKEFFLILYLVIGIWILQPKLNEILKE